MLRNCKLEQLTSNYKYFKGKIFTPDPGEPALDDLDHLSLRKMKTLNFEYSPRNEFAESVKPKLVSRESLDYNSRASFDDSFSSYL
jgi:hypothetical protein